jgi:phytoene dehydrogenase-like protein
MEVACHTATDETLSAGEGHVVSMFCQCFPSDVDAVAAAEVAIDRFAQVCPDFPDCVMAVLPLGPRELEERFGLTGGHIFHGDMLGGQLFEGRPGSRRFGGVDSLYLAGSGARPGGAVTGAPGYLAAQAVLQDAATPAAL